MTDREPYRFEADTRSAKERDYLTRLEETLAASPYSHVEQLMNFALYTPRQDLTKFLCRYEIFQRIVGVHGAIVECGVFFGGGLMTWAQLSAVFEPTNHTRRVVGFDTFAGFPRLSDADAGAGSPSAHEGGLAVDSLAEIERCVELYDANRPIGHVPRVELVRGDARATIPAYCEQNPHLVVALLYLDFDVYEPTKIALERFIPLMPKGAVVAFDELNMRDWPGETVATLEALDIRSLRLERFPFGSTISFAVLD